MKATILVVDACQDYGTTLQRIIRSMGHNAEYTGSIEEAKQYLENSDNRSQTIHAAIIAESTEDGFPDDFAQSLTNLPYIRLTTGFAESIPQNCAGLGAFEKINLELDSIRTLVSRLVDRAANLEPQKRTREHTP